MLSALAALMLLCAEDGGGHYVTTHDYEWPLANPLQSSPGADLVIRSDSAAQGDYGTPGATTISDWDGGYLVDLQGLRSVRGPTNIYYRFYAAGEGWPKPDAGGGGKVEVCYTPHFDTGRECIQPYDPYWTGSNYLFDLWDGSSHTVVCIIGHGTCDHVFCRTANSLHYTDFDVAGGDRLGQAYCLSVEWTFVDASQCNVWVRRDGCGLARGIDCHASTIIASDTSGTAACPAETVYAWLGNRWSENAPTSVSISALRVGRK